MIAADKLEIWLSGYLEGLVGKEFTRENYNKTFSVIDDILHSNHAANIEVSGDNEPDWAHIERWEEMHIKSLKMEPIEPIGRILNGLFD